MATAGTFHQAIRLHRGRRIGREHLAKAFWRCPRVRAMTVYARDLFRVREPVDSLLVEMWLVFERVSLSKLDHPDNVYKVLSATSRNVCRTFRGKESSQPLTESDIMDDDNAEGFIERAAPPDQADLADDVTTALDTRRAREAFSAKLTERGWPEDVPAPPRPAPETDMPIIVPHPLATPVPPQPHAKILKQEEAAYTRLQIRRVVLLPDAAELKRIRSELGMSINVMADHLGIGGPRLGTYLYGVVREIPPDIMARARELYRDYRNSIASSKLAEQDLAEKSLDAIFDGWMDRLAIDYKDDRHAGLRQLAVLIDRHPTAFPRWRMNRPGTDVLRRLELKVTELAAERIAARAVAARRAVKAKTARAAQKGKPAVAARKKPTSKAKSKPTKQRPR